MTSEVVVRSDVAVEPSCSLGPEWSQNISDGFEGLSIRRADGIRVEWVYHTCTKSTLNVCCIHRLFPCNCKKAGK